MELVASKTLNSNQPWQVHVDASNQSIELFFTDELQDSVIDDYLRLVRQIVEIIPVKTLLINDQNIKKDPLRLDWKIIETSWVSFCRKGGNRVVVIHQSNLPIYMKEIYWNALRIYNIPIELEFKCKGSRPRRSEVIHAVRPDEQKIK
jgi:hypothetical protein